MVKYRRRRFTGVRAPVSFEGHPGITREAMASLPDRVERFDAGQMSIDGIAMLIQDLIYVGVIWTLPSKFAVAARHYIDAGLCTTNGRLLQ